MKTADKIKLVQATIDFFKENPSRWSNRASFAMSDTGAQGARLINDSDANQFCIIGALNRVGVETKLYPFDFYRIFAMAIAHEIPFPFQGDNWVNYNDNVCNNTAEMIETLEETIKNLQDENSLV